MEVERIVILESNRNEQRIVREVCRKLVGNVNVRDDNIQILPVENEPHCDAIIYGQIDNMRIAILLEITGRNIEREDYTDKPDNTKRYIEGSNIESMIAIHTSEGLRSYDAKLIPKGILIIDCRRNKRLCEYLEP